MAFDLAGLRILVIDDTDDDRDLIRLIFMQHGAEAELARSVAEGLAAFARGAPDIVICDLLLGPDEPRGDEFVENLERSPDDPGPRVPVLLVTGHERDFLPRHLLAAGFDDVCPKPFSPDELVDVVARLTGRAAAH